MKTRVILFTFIFLGVLIACKKDKFTTIPQVKVKSISPGTVVQGNIIQLEAPFTDEEGDVDSVYIVYKWYDNNTVRKSDTFRYHLASLNLPPKTRDGDIIAKYAYGKFIQGYTTIGAVLKDTTAAFGVVLLDKAGNRSAYAESDRIRLKQ